MYSDDKSSVPSTETLAARVEMLREVVDDHTRSVDAFARRVQEVEKRMEELGFIENRIGNAERVQHDLKEEIAAWHSHDTARRVSALEEKVKGLTPVDEVTSTHPDTPAPDWFEPDGMSDRTREGIRKFRRSIAGGRQSGKRFYNDWVAKTCTPDPTIFRVPPKMRKAVQPERKPPFTLEYMDGRGCPLCEIYEEVAARDLAHGFVDRTQIGVACRDASGVLMFEVKPGEVECS